MKIRQVMVAVVILLAVVVLGAGLSSEKTRAADLGVATGPTAGSCPTGCVPGGCFVLVMRYTVNEADPEHPPEWVTKETFTEDNYPSEAAAYCAAEQFRKTGVKLPTLGRFGRDSNVMPESMTPMPAM